MYDKVNRCLARYSPRATTTNRPTTGHWISLHGLAQIDQKCQFWAKFGRFGAKNPNFYWKNQKFCYPHKVNRCLARYSPRATTTNRPTNRALNSLHGLAQIDQKCQFWAKFGRFWAKNPFFTGEIKSFVTHITENPPRHLVHIVFWSVIGQNVQKMAIFGPKWPKMQILDQIWPFLGQKS